jgi:hypothetical protein
VSNIYFCIKIQICGVRSWSGHEIDCVCVSLHKRAQVLGIIAEARTGGHHSSDQRLYQSIWEGLRESAAGVTCGNNEALEASWRKANVIIVFSQFKLINLIHTIQFIFSAPLVKYVETCRITGLFVISILETRKHDVSETRSVSETSCFLVSRIPDDGKFQKKNPVILCYTPSSEPFRIYLCWNLH